MVDIDGIHPVIAKAMRVVRAMAINGEPIGLRVKSMESNFTTDPKSSVPVPYDVVIVEAPVVIFRLKSGESLSCWIEMAETLPLCAPERSVLVHKQALRDALITPVSGSPRNRIFFQCAGISVIPFESAVCAEPDDIGSLLDNRKNRGPGADGLQPGVFSCHSIDERHAVI